MKTLLTTAALAALATSALAQVIYTPNIALADQKITLKPWGSGTIAETNELAFSGTTSIRVSSRNFFQGGIIVFENPVDLGALSADKSNLFLITVQSSSASTTFGGNAGTGGPVTSGAGGGAAAGGGLAGGEGGVKGGGGARGGAPAVQNVTIDATLTKVRCIVTTTDDKKSEVYIDLTSALPNVRGWKSVGVPLVSIPGFDKSNRKVKQIAFSGDTIGTFYVGELKVLNDSSPLYVEPTVREANLALGDEISITAIGSGGASQLTYTWDFDAKDGVDVDATGMTVRRRFRKPGEYTITLTVNDKFGLKKPYSTTIKVTINP
jgi:PKD repeat protein